MLTQLRNKRIEPVSKSREETPSKPQNKSQKNDDDDAAPKFQPKESTLTFSDIAGLDSVKDTCLDYVRTVQHMELAKQRGLKTGGVMLFFGPPGTGKTMLARAVAGELGLPFYIAKCSELLSKWYGESTKNLAALFEQPQQNIPLDSNQLPVFPDLETIRELGAGGFGRCFLAKQQCWCTTAMVWSTW